MYEDASKFPLTRTCTTFLKTLHFYKNKKNMLAALNDAQVSVIRLRLPWQQHTSSEWKEGSGTSQSMTVTSYGRGEKKRKEKKRKRSRANADA